MDGPYYRRKIYDTLLGWKSGSDGRQAILIEGARRVGKTTVVTRFAKENYRSHIIVDFSKTYSDDVKEWMKTFDSDLDQLFVRLKKKYGVELYERDSLIVFDEVQSFPLARQMIKQLVEDRRYDYIETGSLISLRKNVKNIVIPSEERHIQMHPMDFEEFLWALGDTGTMDLVRMAFRKREPMGRATHRRLMNTFSLYMVIGGMPQAVQAFLVGNSIDAAETAKESILDLYLGDAGKEEDRCAERAQRMFRNIPISLSNHGKSFKPSQIRKGSRTRDYLGSAIWLSESKMVDICYRVSDPSPAMGQFLDEMSFKMYMADTGLLMTSAFRFNVGTKEGIYSSLLNGKMNVNRGMFFENVVAQQITAAGRELIFFRFRPEGSTNSYEIDFFLEDASVVSPVEVKSSNSGAHASLDRFVEVYGKNRRLGESYVIHTKDLRVDGRTVYLPVYMTGVLAEKVTDEAAESKMKDAWSRLLADSLVNVSPKGDRESS